MARQTGFHFRTWGGARKGAGRKPAGAEAGASHVRRPKVDDRVPLHLTMRVAGVPSLRSQQCIKVMRARVPRREGALRLPARALRRPAESSSLDRRGQEQAGAQQRRAWAGDPDRDAAQSPAWPQGEGLHGAVSRGTARLAAAGSAGAHVRSSAGAQARRGSAARADDDPRSLLVGARLRRIQERLAAGGAVERDGRRGRDVAPHHGLAEARRDRSSRDSRCPILRVPRLRRRLIER